MELNVAGMTCQHCVRAVTHAVQAVPGVASVRIDLAQGRVEVQGEADREAVAAAISEQGYDVI